KSAVFFRGINTWTKAKVTGVFSNIQGQVTYDKTDMQTSKVHLRIPVKSLKTQKADVKHKRFKQVSDENLANHMLSEPFFGLYRKKGREKIINPQGQYIKFTSTSVEALGGDLEQQQLNICGTLIIRGKRKANQCFKGRLENTTLKGSPAKRFVGRTTINRKDFGVGKGWMTFTIGNNVDIQMNILLRGQGSVASQQQTLRPQSSS
ncbi:MAG: YceI family protein, partial [Myxococcota bacterium]